jgi:hypothetical protein
VSGDEERGREALSFLSEVERLRPDGWDDEPVEMPEPPSGVAAAALALLDEFGWWSDPVLSAGTALEMAEVVARALAEHPDQ